MVGTPQVIVSGTRAVVDPRQAALARELYQSLPSDKEDSSWETVRMLLPYSGDRQPEHLGSHGPPHTVDRYASDRSGAKTYRFNALGFRGESLDPGAILRVFICGASYAFGTGLNWEETWGYRLKVKLAKHHSVDPTDVNLLNFSQSFASANYIARTLIAQCGRMSPDLVVVHFSDMTRTECFIAGSPIGVMPVGLNWLTRAWTLRPGWRRRVGRWMPGLRDREDASQRLRVWDSYGRLFSVETGFVNTLSNILLLQSFCRMRGIECLISWSQHETLSEPRFTQNPAIAPLITALDRDRILSFSLVDSKHQADLAADGIHPGPTSNDLYARRLVEAYQHLSFARRRRAQTAAVHWLRTGT